jgi:D-arabinose 1-dehydrogenase-like Zn-dependent alcohol dehydrogenase
MSRMRVVQVSSANGPFEVVERDVPTPAPRQVRIKVEACGICHSDSFTKMGAFPGMQFPRVPGHEVVGVLDAVGSEVPEWNVGVRVGVGWHGGHCGHCTYCRQGDFITCSTGKSLVFPTTAATPST